MAKLVEAKVVEQVIRRYLEGKSCALSPPKKRGQTGPDIVARRGKSTWFVGVIRSQEVPWIRSREFYEAFFPVISRDRGRPFLALGYGMPILSRTRSRIILSLPLQLT
jgi:hypothetical protein